MQSDRPAPIHRQPLGLVGRRLDAEIRRRAACTLDFSIGFEILPKPQNRLTLSSEHKDALGIPHPEVTYDVGDYVRKGGDKVRPRLLHIASLLEAIEVKITDQYNANSHVMGGTIMGRDLGAARHWPITPRARARSLPEPSTLRSHEGRGC